MECADDAENHTIAEAVVQQVADRQAENHAAHCASKADQSRHGTDV